VEINNNNMNSICNTTAHIKSKNNEEVDSILYKEILHKTKDRNLTNKLWSAASLAKDENVYPGAKLDENGEYTIDTFMKLFNIEELLNDKQNALNSAEKLGLIDSKGNAVSFNNASSLMSAMIEFNNSQKNYLAQVEFDKDGHRMAIIVPRTNANITVAPSIKFKSELNSRLLNLLNKMGFNMSFMTSNNKFGVFDPFNAEKNADTLKTVIKISHDEAGIDSFPEEFSHVIFAGLKDSIYAQRLDKVFTDEMTQSVLGDEYKDYIAKYSEDEGIDAAIDYAKEEAEARVLTAMLRGESKGLDIIKRFWVNAMRKVSFLSEDDINSAIDEATKIIGNIVKDINTGEIVNKIDKEAVLKHRAMFNLEEKSAKLKSIAEKGEELLNKRLSLLRDKQNINDAKSEEVLKIKQIRLNLAAKRYAISCYSILEAMNHHIVITAENIDDYLKMGTLDILNLTQLSSRAASIKDATNMIDSYTPYINVLVDIQHYIDNGEIEMDADSVEQIKSIAQQSLTQLNDLDKRMKELRTSTLLTLIRMYVGPNQLQKIGQIRGKDMTIEMILNQADDDINALDSNLFSLGDSRNELVNVVHEIIKRQQATRDRKVNEIAAMLTEADRQLKEAGETSDFMVERDEKGIPTGYFKSFVDYDKFYKARKEFVSKLIKDNNSLPNDQKKDYASIGAEIAKWEYENTEEKIINITDENGQERVMKERIPVSYKNENGQGKYYKDINFNKAQQDYWNKIIEIKARLQQVLPTRAQHIFEIPQLYKDLAQSLNIDQPGESLKQMSKYIKREFSMVEDNTGYGELDEHGNPISTTMTDLSGVPLKTVPVYFVRKIKDKKLLSTDITKNMIAYTIMSVNYSEMRKISDILQVLNDRVKEEYNITRVKGGETVQDVFKSINKTYKNNSVIKGEGSNIQKAIETIINRMVFDITKEKLPTINLGKTGKSIDVNSAISLGKSYTSVSNLGLNLFSGLNNVIMGDAQMLVKAVGGDYFNIKDLGKARLLYAKLLPEFLGKMNSTVRDDKMSLLINLFNSSEDFSRAIQDTNYNSKFYQRVLGKSNIYFLQSMGEHKLHTEGMLAMLNHIKVNPLDSKGNILETKPLYDCLTVVHDNIKGSHIELSSPIRINYDKYKGNVLKSLYPRNDEDSVVIDNNNFDTLSENLNVYINNVNASMHGGYSEIEKGNGNTKAWFQLLMQFRQWMPATYNERFSRPYYDAILGENREGFYITLGKFLLNTTRDLMRGNIQLSLNDKNLTDGQKANLKKAFSEITLFVVLAVVCSMTKNYENKDSAWHKKMLAYQLQRLKLDTGSMVPTTSMVDNMWQILQSPMAGMEGMHNLFNVFKFQNCAIEVEQGRYKGWSVYARDLLKATPFQSIVKVKDLSTENYMFSIFKLNNQ